MGGMSATVIRAFITCPLSSTCDASIDTERRYALLPHPVSLVRGWGFVRGERKPLLPPRGHGRRPVRKRMKPGDARF